MHYMQYLHHIHFILYMYHKPFEWFITRSNTHGRRGCLVNMLQDFSFKIIHKVGAKHTTVDTLSRNFVGILKEDEDFQVEILNMKVMTPFAVGKEEE